MDSLDDLPENKALPPPPPTPKEEQAGKKRKPRPSEEDYKSSTVRTEGIQLMMRTPPKPGEAFRRLEEAAGIRRDRLSRAGSKRNKSRKQKRKTKKHGRR